MCVWTKGGREEVGGGNKGIWLQNWVTVWNTWLPVVKDEQHWGKSQLTRNHLRKLNLCWQADEEGQLRAGVLSWSWAPFARTIVFCISASERDRRYLNTASPQVSPFKRADPPLPCLVNVCIISAKRVAQRELLLTGVLWWVLVRVWDCFFSREHHSHCSKMKGNSSRRHDGENEDRKSMPKLKMGHLKIRAFSIHLHD